MPDSLDLNELTRQAEQNRRLSRRRWLLGAIVLVIGAAVLVWLGRTTSRATTLYVQPGGIPGAAWQPVTVPGVPTDVQVTAGGTVWVQTTETLTLYRYDGSVWTPYEFDTHYSYVNAFTLAGEDLWAIVDNSSVLHFDGSQWDGEQDVFQGDLPQAIAAGDSGMLVAGFNGSLWWRGPSGGWTQYAAAQTLPGFSTGGYDDYPSLCAGPDGAVWLEYYGVWRFDGQGWQLMLPVKAYDAISYELVGADEEGVWVTTVDGISRIDAADGSVQDFNLQNTVAANSAIYNAVARADGSVWLATSAGLVLYDGSSWKLDPVQPPTAAYAVTHLAAAPDGTLWAVIYDPGNFAQSYYSLFSLERIFSLACGPWLLLILVCLVVTVPARRAHTRRLRQARELLLQAVPDLEAADTPDERSGPSFGWVGRVLILLVVLMVVLSLFGLPPGASLMLIVPVFALQSTWPLLTRLFDDSLDEKTRAYLRRNVALGAGLVALLLGLSFLVLRSVLDPALFESPLAVLGFIIIGGAVTLVLVYAVQLLPSLFIYRGPLARADYTAALRQAAMLRQWSPRYAAFAFIHGYVLLTAGRDAEAEPIWWEVLAEMQHSNANSIAVCLVNLCGTLMGQQRYAEALPLLECAARTAPENSAVYRALAHYYQETGASPARALEMTDHMLRWARRPLVNLYLQRVGWSYVLGVRALALADVGRQDESSRLMDRAFREGDRTFRPAQAVLHSLAGRIRQRQGDRDGAAEQFRWAIEVDPEGDGGQRARRELEALASAASSS